MVMFFQRVGLSSHDVVIKVSSRQLLQAVLEQHHIPVEATSRVFVTVDKMDKLPKETVRLPHKDSAAHSYITNYCNWTSLLQRILMPVVCIVRSHLAHCPTFSNTSFAAGSCTCMLPVAFQHVSSRSLQGSMQQHLTVCM